MSLSERENTAVVSTSDGPESFLTSGIPDLQFAGFPINFCHFEPEVYSDGWQVVVDEVIITETDEEGRLAHALVADDDYFEEEILLFDH